MTLVDVVLLLVMLLSVVIGMLRGLIYEVLSVLGWVAAFFVAQWLAPDAAEHLPVSWASASVQVALAFVLVFVATAFVGGLLAWTGKKLVDEIGLRPVDRTLGAGFGLLRGMVLLLAAAAVIGMTPLAQASWWQESTGAALLQAGLKGMKPLLPAAFAGHLPE